jgi:hypothetical protein
MNFNSITKTHNRSSVGAVNRLPYGRVGYRCSITGRDRATSLLHCIATGPRTHSACCFIDFSHVKNAREGKLNVHLYLSGLYATRSEITLR